MAPKRNYKRKATKKPYKKRTTKPLSSAKRITKICKSVISSQIENKIMNYTFPVSNLVSYGTAAWGGNQCFPLSPYPSYANAVQGTSQNQRIGNILNIKKATIKLLFNQVPYNATANPTPVPLLIKIITFYDRSSPVVLPTLTVGLYQNGSTSSNPSTGSNIDILKSINKDQWIVKSSKTIKLGYSIYNTVVGGQSTYQFHANNDFPMFNTFSMDYTKHLVKQVKYNDTTANPTTRGLFMAMYIMAADGSTITNGLTQANFQGYIEIQYEDA